VAASRQTLFAVLVREHEAGLRAFVRSCITADGDADDIIQDAFAVAWRRIDDYDTALPFNAWLRGIAKKRILAFFRAAGSERHGVRLLPPEAVAAIADEHERLARPARGEVYRDCFGALEECMQTLSHEDRQIVESAYRERDTCRTIAERLGRTIEAIKKRLQRARSELRDCIEGKLSPEPGGP
jgi:RNA polymerase sigma-70 factor (ECF subfamily)